jgi:hypothetical protein
MSPISKCVHLEKICSRTWGTEFRVILAVIRADTVVPSCDLLSVGPCRRVETREPCQNVLQRFPHKIFIIEIARTKKDRVPVLVVR